MNSASSEEHPAAPAEPHTVVIGEALVDIVHRTCGATAEAPGGSPANTALALGRLGRRTTLITALAGDDRGRRVRRWLKESGVEVIVVAAERTSTATARLDATGSASYEFDLEWNLGADLSLPLTLTSGADLLHLGSVAAVLEPGASQVEHIVRSARSHAVVTYDPNIRPSLVDDPPRVRDRVERCVGLAHLVKASDEDIRWLHPQRDPIEVAREWVAGGPGLVVVTLGAGGAVGVTTDGEIAVSAAASQVVDTVGAGDTFMGALIDGLVDRPDLWQTLRTVDAPVPIDDVGGLLRRAALAAAITVSRPGADPPRRAELGIPVP